MATQIANASALPSIADRTLMIDQTEIAYKDSGAGRVILCLHAVGHSSADFESLYELPLDKYRVIAIDFPGHGKSGKPMQAISASYFKKVVDSFVRAMNLHDIVIVGNSIGGATAIRLASDNPNIKALALADPGGMDKRGLLAPLFINYMVRFFKTGEQAKPSFKLKFEKYYRSVLPAAAADKRRSEISGSAYEIAPLLVEAWQSFGRDEEDLRPIITTIKCPVLFTWGTKDKIVQLSRNKKSINKFIDHTLITYPIGHTPYVECPDEFLSDLRAFLTKVFL